MDQPKGYTDVKKPNYKCLLKNYIYGLKQALRAWHEKFTPALLEFGLTQSKSDPFLFIRRQQGEILIVIIYVDDTLVFFNNKSSFLELTNHLKKLFEIRVLPATRFVGIDIVKEPGSNRKFFYIKAATRQNSLTNSKWPTVIQNPFLAIQMFISEKVLRFKKSICQQTHY